MLGIRKKTCCREGHFGGFVDWKSCLWDPTPRSLLNIGKELNQGHGDTEGKTNTIVSYFCFGVHSERPAVTEIAVLCFIPSHLAMCRPFHFSIL